MIQIYVQKRNLWMVLWLQRFLDITLNQLDIGVFCKRILYSSKVIAINLIYAISTFTTLLKKCNYSAGQVASN